MFLSILAIILTFGVVIFFHELGHFLLCKWMKVRVERIAFGFGPEIFGFTRGETKFSICALPLGGFVKPTGETPEECKGIPEEYFSRPWYQKFCILVAGPLMNFVLAFTLCTGVAYVIGGRHPSHSPIVGEVVPGYPAKLKGLQEGDKILQVEGKKIETWEEMADKIHVSANKAISMTIERPASGKNSPETFVVIMTPRPDFMGKIGVVGINPMNEYIPLTFPNALIAGLYESYLGTRMQISLFNHQILEHDLSYKLSAGPIGIVQGVSRAAHSHLGDLIMVIAMLSGAFGFFNLLPIPWLDGGHAVLCLWEGFSHERLRGTSIRMFDSFGKIFVVFLVILATYLDFMGNQRDRNMEQVIQEIRPYTQHPVRYNQK